jgi:hypothetical protein
MGKRGAGLLVVGALVPLAIFLQGCSGGLGGFEDVPFNVTVTNDTAHDVVAHPSFENGPVLLKPGHSFSEIQESNEGVNPDRITSVGGTTLGCLPFQFSQNVSNLRVRVTQMVPCKHWGFQENLPRDWPNPKD